MAPLKNPRHEKFCQAYIRGPTAGNASASYVAAGYEPLRQNACRLLRRDGVRRRIDELRAQLEQIEAEARARAIEETKLDKQWVLARLMENAEIALGRKTVKRKMALDGKQVEIEVTERDGAAANRALELLGREVGVCIERKHIHHHEHADKSDEQLAIEIAAIARELGYGENAKTSSAAFADGREAPTGKLN